MGGRAAHWDDGRCAIYCGGGKVHRCVRCIVAHSACRPGLRYAAGNDGVRRGVARKKLAAVVAPAANRCPAVRR